MTEENYQIDLIKRLKHSIHTLFASLEFNNRRDYIFFVYIYIFIAEMYFKI